MPPPVEEVDVTAEAGVAVADVQEDLGEIDEIAWLDRASPPPMEIGMNTIPPDQQWDIEEDPEAYQVIEPEFFFIEEGMFLDDGDPGPYETPWGVDDAEPGVLDPNNPVVPDTIHIPEIDMGAPGKVLAYQGITQTEWQPPDPHMAVGPFDYILAVNDDFAGYDKCGKKLFQVDINAFINDNRKIFDCKVVYDPWNNRYFMLYLLIDSESKVSQQLMFVSKDSRATGDWCLYRLNGNTGSGGTLSWNDYYDLGYGSLSIHTSGNQFQYSNGAHTGSYIYLWPKAKMLLCEATTVKRIGPMKLVDNSNAFGVRSAHMQAQPGGGVVGSSVARITDSATAG